MGNFKKNKKIGNNRSGGFTSYTRVCKPDSGFMYITNKITKPDRRKEGQQGITEIRVLPYIEEDIIYDPISPTGSADELYDSLGMAFCNAELLTYFDNGLYTLLTTVKEEDKQGNPIVGPSPWYKFMSRVGFKLMEIHANVSRGGAVEPAVSHWVNLRSSNFSRPQKLFMVQCVARIIDGEIPQRNGKASIVGPGVFAISKGIENKTVFFTEMFTKKDALSDSPLRVEECELGDFYSLENGRWMQLRRTDKDGNTTYNLKVTDVKMPLSKDKVTQMIKPWDEVLDIKYAEDSLKEIADKFEPRMLAYAFKNTMYEPYVHEMGIDMSLADGIIEADKDIVRKESTKLRSKEEVDRYLQSVGHKKPAADSTPFDDISDDVSNDVFTPDSTINDNDTDDMGDIPFTEDQAANNSDAFQDALKNMTAQTDDNDELSL